MTSEQTHGTEHIPAHRAALHATSGQRSRSSHKSNGASGSVDDPVSQTSESIAKANDVQGKTTNLTAERVKGLLSVYANYAHGLLEMQRTYVDLTHRSLELTQRATRELIRCNGPSELAEVQRELLREGMNQVFEGASKVLQASSKVTADAIRPIEEQLKRAAI